MWLFIGIVLTVSGISGLLFDNDLEELEDKIAKIEKRH